MKIKFLTVESVGTELEKELAKENAIAIAESLGLGWKIISAVGTATQVQYILGIEA